MKTEAERRWQYFKDLEQDAVPERLALFRAIFDPLPPEPEAETPAHTTWGTERSAASTAGASTPSKSKPASPV